MTDEQLQEIEKFGGLLYPPDKVAVIVGMSAKAFREELEDEESPVFQAYYRGLYLSEAAIRESVIAHAKAGSSPAQQMALQFIEEVKVELI